MGSPNLSLCSAQSLKILGEKVSEISLNRDTVSEVLRCFLTAHGAGAELCEGLRTKPFQALPPERKAAILVFLVNELNSSALIIRWGWVAGGTKILPSWILERIPLPWILQRILLPSRSCPLQPPPSRVPAARSTRPWRTCPTTGRTSGSSRADSAGWWGRGSTCGLSAFPSAPGARGVTGCLGGRGVGRGTGAQHLHLCPGRLKVALAKKTGRPESEITGLEDGRRRRSSRLTEDAGLEMEEEEETRGRKSRREEEVGCSGLCRGGGGGGATSGGSLP